MANVAVRYRSPASLSPKYLREDRTAEAVRYVLASDFILATSMADDVIVLEVGEPRSPPKLGTPAILCSRQRRIARFHSNPVPVPQVVPIAANADE